MLYGWIEVGASNTSVFSNTNNDDIIIRTIRDTNKIIIGNSDATNANAVSSAMYIKGNNVGISKVPDANVALDVNGFTVLRSCQVGLSNSPTSLTLNGTYVMKDVGQPFTTTTTDIVITNANNEFKIGYPSASRVTVTNGNGITLNDTVVVTKDIFSTGFNLTSDKTLKTNICTSCVHEDLAMLSKLRVCDYMFKHAVPTTTHTTKGFIAQEVQEVLPGAVKDMSGIKTIDIAQLVALNTSVIQHLLHRIETLQNYIESNK